MTTQSFLEQSIDWFKNVGLVLLLHYVFSAVVTWVFRERTPEQAEAWKKAHPIGAKVLRFGEVTGLNSPEAWKWIVGLLFARTLKNAGEKAQDVGVPPEPPSIPGA